MLTIKRPCSRMSFKGGYTLVEVLICSVLFLAFIMISWGLFSSMFKNYHKGEERVRPILQLRNALYFVNARLKGAVEVCNNPEMLKALCSEAGSDYILFNTYAPDDTFCTVGFSTEQMNGENALIFRRYETPTGAQASWPPPEIPGYRRTVLYPVSVVKFQMLRNDIVFLVHLGTMVAIKDTFESVDKSRNIDQREAIDLKTMVFRRPMGIE